MFYNLEQSRFVLDPHNTINIFFVYITTVYCWNYITYLQGKRLISPIASPFFQLFSEKKQQTCFFLSYSSFVLISFFFFLYLHNDRTDTAGAETPLKIMEMRAIYNKNKNTKKR